MTLAELVGYFLRLGTIGFGGPAALVGYMRRDLVERGDLDEGTYNLALALAQIMPGPVVITVAFIGYLVAGAAGAVVAAIGIFLPVYVLTIVPAPWFKRHRDNAQLRAFVAGATAAASGAIAGAVVVLGQRAITDVSTAAIALLGLLVLWRWRLPEPILVAAAGVAGLLVWPLVQS